MHFFSSVGHVKWNSPLMIRCFVFTSTTSWKMLSMFFALIFPRAIFFSSWYNLHSSTSVVLTFYNYSTIYQPAISEIWKEYFCVLFVKCFPFIFPMPYLIYLLVQHRSQNQPRCNLWSNFTARAQVMSVMWPWRCCILSITSQTR